ncbi:PadR family transcriptional regulator [Deinococcus psychrotolerans]|uniref:PadR family transcriptional regulator n=1 Tax=Deinococcus psychrotolerans TaxID=2489213 RepID=UPI001F14A197|nr:helix-turn-helix transcriptional regulator [Deinococcus psychrotolerans]
MDTNKLRGHLDLVLLATLEGGPLYGLKIIQEVQGRTEGAFSFKEGTLYPALHRLEKQKLIAASQQPSDIGGPPRKVYRLTESGEKRLREEQTGWRTFAKAMQPFGGV